MADVLKKEIFLEIACEMLHMHQIFAQHRIQYSKILQNSRHYYRRIFVIGGRDRSNVCCDWMLEYKDECKTLIHKVPMFLKRSDFTPAYSKSGFVYVIGGNDAKIF